MWERVKRWFTAAFVISLGSLAVAIWAFYRMGRADNPLWLLLALPASVVSLIFGDITWDEDRGGPEDDGS